MATLTNLRSTTAHLVDGETLWTDEGFAVANGDDPPYADASSAACALVGGGTPNNPIFLEIDWSELPDDRDVTEIVVGVVADTLASVTGKVGVFADTATQVGSYSDGQSVNAASPTTFYFTLTESQFGSLTTNTVKSGILIGLQLTDTIGEGLDSANVDSVWVSSVTFTDPPATITRRDDPRQAGRRGGTVGK